MAMFAFGRNWIIRSLVVGIQLAVADLASAKRAIPEDNLAYPVLLHLKASSGSGFYLNTSSAMYLVTAKHVLFDPTNNDSMREGPLEALSYPKDPKDTHRNILVLDLNALKNAGNISANSSEDVVVVKVANFVAASAPNAEAQPKSVSPTQPAPTGQHIALVSGVSVKESAGNIVGVVMESGVKKFDEVLVGNDVIMFGYPTSLALVPNPKVDFLRPLLRKGLVAGENPAQHSIVLDCPSYQGDSGGPVLEVDADFPQVNYKVIGVVSSFIPFADTWRNEHFNYSNTTLQNSGYSVITPMDYVLELIK